MQLVILDVVALEAGVGVRAFMILILAVKELSFDLKTALLMRSHRCDTCTNRADHFKTPGPRPFGCRSYKSRGNTISLKFRAYPDLGIVGAMSGDDLVFLNEGPFDPGYEIQIRKFRGESLVGSCSMKNFVIISATGITISAVRER